MYESLLFPALYVMIGSISLIYILLSLLKETFLGDRGFALALVWFLWLCALLMLLQVYVSVPELDEFFVELYQNLRAS